MKFQVKADLHYEVHDATTLVLNVHALRTPSQTVLEESLIIDPYMKAEELLSREGENRFIRIEVTEPGDVLINYKAIVDNSFKIIEQDQQVEVPISQMDTSIFPYLFPSRYCQSDKLFRFAGNQFGHIENPFLKVMAITDWIHDNVEYLSGSTNSQTSAFDTVTEQAGVCRDFAHLGIALCRALSIPARYFTGYAYLLKPPDFHACFEAYLGGEWILFDATRLAPLNGLVKIATGRDAADTALATIFGRLNTKSIQVSCQAMEDNFQPLFYQPSDCRGVCYL